MFVTDYISKDYPAFDFSESLEKVKETVEGLDYSHAFVQKDGIFLGCIRRDVIKNSSKKEIGALHDNFEVFAMLDNSTILDSIKVFNSFDANVAPVINNSKEYLGYISSGDIFQEISKYPFFSENGAFLIIETPSKGYSLTEVAKIVESSNIRLYGAFVYQIMEDSVQIALKVNDKSIRTLIETFERFGYLIIDKFSDTENDDMIKNRFEFLQKFLEM